MSAKFAHCHVSGGLMWCQHFNGSWAPPFPATNQTGETPKTSEEQENEEAKNPSNDELSA